MPIIKLKFLFFWVVIFIGSNLVILGLDEKEIKSILDSKKYFKSKLTPIIGTKNKFVCTFSRGPDFLWNYGLAIIEINEKDILFHDEFIGCNFDNVYSIKHPDIDNPIICFTDLTHRGNGKYDIYVFENNKLNHLFTATGQHREWGWLEQYQLKPFLKDKNGDGILDFVFEGEIKMKDQEGIFWFGMSYSYEETFLYDKVKGFNVEPQIVYDFEKKIKNAMKMSKGEHQSRNRGHRALYEEFKAGHILIDQVELWLNSNDIYFQSIGAFIAFRINPQKYEKELLVFYQKAIEIPNYEFWSDIRECIESIKDPKISQVYSSNWENLRAVKSTLDSKFNYLIKSEIIPIVGANCKYIYILERQYTLYGNEIFFVDDLNNTDIFYHDMGFIENVISFKHPLMINPIVGFAKLNRRGNGIYEFFTLDDNKLVPLLFGSGARLESFMEDRYFLKPVFKDKNNDGAIDLILEGQKETELLGSDLKEKFSYFYEEVFLYEKNNGFEKIPQTSYDFQKRIEIAIKLVKGNFECRARASSILFDELQVKHFTIDQMEKMLDSEELHTQAVGARIANRFDSRKYHDKIMNFCNKAFKIPEHEFWYDIQACHHGNDSPIFDEVLKGDWEK